MRIQSENEIAIFDLDGTLIDTAGDLVAALNYALREAGFEQTHERKVREFVGLGARHMLKKGIEFASGRLATPSEIESGLVDFLDFYAANIAVKSRPFAGALPFVHALRHSGWLVAICTNKRQELADRLLESLEIYSLFDVIVGAREGRPAKPDPAPIQLCMGQAGVNKGFFVGDSDVDIQAAAAAGLPCYVASFGYGPLSVRSNQVQVFNDFRALERLILLKR